MSVQLTNQTAEIRYFPTELLPAYHPTIADIFSIASRMGVSVVEADRQSWHVMAYTARALDTAVDAQGASVGDLEEFISDIKAGLPFAGYGSDMAHLFALLYPQLPEYKQKLIDSEAPTLVTFKETLVHTTSRTELIELKRAEAKLLSDMFAMDRFDLGDEKERLAFNKFIEKFMFAGYLLDTVTDLKDDVRNGLVPEKLMNKRVQLHLAGVALKETASMRGMWHAQNLLAILKVAARNKSRTDT
jgi:hypothetical protein